MPSGDATQPETPFDDEPVTSIDKSRYRQLERIGRGGMGEVIALQDERLGRVVALKYLRKHEGSKGEDAHRRFVREARVQGQLEHPAIVPVYDLWLEPVPRFTMKRVRGQTLAEVLKAKRAGATRHLDAEQPHFTRHRLLTAFNSICLALDFAHENGVIHRDVKPANIMLGDYGEVYLLDWGVARVEAADDTPIVQRLAGKADPDLTSPGEVLGTLGYVAPEQLRGDPVDRRTDVFALGAILFEILTHERLFGGDEAERANKTLSGVDVEAAARASGAEVPPALLDIVRRATHPESDRRHPSARALNEEVERHLAGEEDLTRRRAASVAQAAEAEAIFDRAEEIGEEQARDEAMLKLGRALALDPENESAMEVIVRILRTPPKVMPRDVAQIVDKRWQVTSGKVVPGLVGAHLGVFIFMPLVVWMGVQSVPLLVAMLTLNALAVVAELWARRATDGARATDITIIVSTVWSTALLAVFGPFVLVPAIASITTIAYLLVRRRQRAIWVAAFSSAAFVVPAVLQFVGVLPPSYLFEGDSIRILPNLASFPPAATFVTLVLGNTAVVFLPTLIVSRFRRALVSAERQLQFQAWQLSRLLPEQRREVTR
ncbi:MAG: serine/threonine-protein kinase [Deltaproteobacteria bacterium]